MSTKVSEPLATYFAGHKTHDVDAMIGPFAEGAIVKDEGQERRGLPAIREWMGETTAKSSVIAVTNVAGTAANTTVTGLVSGNTSQVAPSSSASSSHSTKGRLHVWRLSAGCATLLGRFEGVRYQARSRHRRH